MVYLNAILVAEVQEYRLRCPLLRALKIIRS